MKARVTWMVVPALAVGLGACKKETPSETTDRAQTEVTPVAPGVPGVPLTPEAPETKSAEERAEKLGFARYLPQDTEVVLAVYQGENTVEKLKGLKLWEFFDREMGGAFDGFNDEFEMDMEIEEDVEIEDDFEIPEGEQDELDYLDEDDFDPSGGADNALVDEMPTEPTGPADLLGSEVTVAIGKSGGEQLANLVTLNERMTYFQWRTMIKSFLQAATGNEDGDPLARMGLNPQVFVDILNDPESGIGLIERWQMAPIYVAFRVDESIREDAADGVRSGVDFLSMMNETVEPLEVKKAGSTFTGYKILGEKLAESLEMLGDSVGDMIPADTFQRLVTAVSKKDIVVMTGVLGDHVVFFAGSSVDEFNPVSDVEDSLVAGDALNFVDGYLSKDLSALIYGEKNALQTVISASGGMGFMLEALRDGVAGEPAFGDTRELEGLLQQVAEREADLRKLMTVDDTGLVAFFEEGYRVETFGGTDQGIVDWTTPLKLSNLGNGPDVALFANLSSSAVYDEKAQAFSSALLEAVYAVTMKVAELPIETEEFKKFKEATELFDTRFRADVAGFWEAFSGDFSAGLGSESALVMDFKGSMPTIPGVPQPIVDEANFPRLSVIAPVVDRAKIATSWEKMNRNATNILATISEIAGTDIPMQRPMNSERDGITSWFFAVPFFSDPPSVALNDDWFAASTSKDHPLELVSEATNTSGGATGLIFYVDFEVLQKYARESYEMVDRNAVALFGEDSSKLEDFRENKEKILELISTFDEFGKVKYHRRLEGDQLRASIHFQTR